MLDTNVPNHVGDKFPSAAAPSRAEGPGRRARIRGLPQGPPGKQGQRGGRRNH